MSDWTGSTVYYCIANVTIVTLSASLSSQIADDYFTEKELEGSRPEIIPEETDDVSPITSPANTERRTLSDLVTGKGDMDPSEEPLSSPPPSESTLPDHQIPVSSVFVFGSTGSLHSEYCRYSDHSTPFASCFYLNVVNFVGAF